ncbi:unnamed protein product [Polarella glacialis]|uniref:GrpE protein homolog n=1 Tax=Polarella glacialis TaxID=89957 RepID=A0A813L6B3_POLGL|nr:unnamed protein product [Polarella glacialis]
MDVPLQQTLRCGGTSPHRGSLRTGSHHLAISERRLRPLLRRISMLVLPLLCFSSLPSFLCSPEGEMACRPSLALRRRGFRDFRCRGFDRVAPRAAEDKETMGDLFTKYFRLQEVNQQLEADTKVKVVAELLEVLDDLELGMKQQGQAAQATAAMQSIALKFRRRLETLGFSPVKTDGAKFDPNVHEAAVERASPGVAAGHVCEELRSGWMCEDKVVRPAIVAVAE